MTRRSGRGARVWPLRWLWRSSRRSRPRPRVIVTGRPYDWELDGFGDDLYGPPLRMPKPHVASSASGFRLSDGGFVDGRFVPVLDYGMTSTNETGNDDDADE